MLSRLDLGHYFGQILSPESFEDYAPNGLQIEGRPVIKKLAFAVSATQDSIKEAIKLNACGLVVHHGVFWKHQGAKTITGPWGTRILECIKNDLNLFAYHLPLDAHPEIGNAASLAKLLGLQDLEPFGVYKRQSLGMKGKLSPKIAAKDLKEKLRHLLSHEVILAGPDESALISSVGIITGGANNDWWQASEAGLDAYLTGEISEYNWHDAIEAGIHYFAGGHHATEKFGIQSLMNKVKKDLNIEVHFIDSKNPA